MNRAEALVGKFLVQRRRRLRMFKGFGKTPSLPRVFAMHGPATACMLLLEAATPQNACQLENGWEKALAPPTNQVAPRMDFAIILWETISNKTINPRKFRDTASRVNSVLTAQHHVCSAHNVCHLVMVSKGYPDERGTLRRLAIPLPPLCDPAKQAVHLFLSGVVLRVAQGCLSMLGVCWGRWLCGPLRQRLKWGISLRVALSRGPQYGSCKP